MSCPWCYIPFTADKVDFETCIRIIDRCAEIGTKIVTFGGGDPLAYFRISELVLRASSKGICVHIDTNGISLRSSHYEMISNAVSLLALPLDASYAKLNDQVRSLEGHFDIVNKALTKCQDLDVAIKINTIVTNQNINNIWKMHPIVESYEAKIWSLYQYWPLSLGKREKKISVSRKEYLDCVANINSASSDVHVESNPFEERIGTYFFVSHMGEVYTHDDLETGEYMFLGSIFEDRTIEAWHASTGISLRESARNRYNINLHNN